MINQYQRGGGDFLKRGFAQFVGNIVLLPEFGAAAVYHYHFAVCIEQGEGIGNTLNSVTQTLTILFGLNLAFLCFPAGQFELLVGLFQTMQGLLQAVGALFYLIGEHGCVFKRLIGITVIAPPHFYPTHQHAVYFLQLLVFVAQPFELIFAGYFRRLNGYFRRQWT